MSERRSSSLSASGRVLLAMALMLGATIVVLVAIGYLITVQALDAELERALEREAQAYRAAIQSAPASQGLAEATRAYLGARTQTGAGRDVVLLVRLPAGRTISNSDISLERAPGNAAMTSTPTVPAFSEFAYEGRGYRVLSAPVRTSEGVVGVFQAAVDTRVVRPTARRVALTLAATGLLSLAIVLPFAYLATRRALRPLRRMAADAERVTHERPGGRLAYDGPKDELGSLADTLNSMLERLETAFDEQRRFIADASHELRTPVAIIRGNVELLRSDVLESGGRDESLGAIEEETARMGRLLDDLLALARFESGTARTEQPLELRSLLEEAAARARALGRSATLSAKCQAWVLGEPDLLDQALANLARNAVAHTQETGSIEFSCVVRGDDVEIAVTDDGPGIAPEDLDRVFDRFYRSKTPRVDEGGGAGLGLSITRRIVEAHRGTIRAENVQPHGARFVVVLPRIDAPSDTLDPASELPGGEGPGGGVG